MKFKMREIKYFLPGLIGIGFFTMILMSGVKTYFDGKSELNVIHERLVKNLSNDLDAFINVETKNLEVAAKLLLNDREVLQLFVWQDRGLLADHLLTIYEDKLKTDFGIKQFQFHLPPAISFLRLHKVDKYGDDLTSFRKTVVKSNAEKIIVSGLEVGLSGLGVRLVHPINYDGVHAGTMEFGTEFKEVLNRIANKNNVTFAVGIFDNVFEAAGRKSNIGNDYTKGKTVYYDYSDPLTKANLKEIDTKQEIESVSLDDKDYAVVSIPIKDYNDMEIGYVTFFQDETEIVSKIFNDFIWGIIIPVFLAGIVLFVLIIVTKKTLMDSIDELLNFTNELANGDYKSKNPVLYFNSFQTLSNSMGQLRDKITEQYQMLENIPSPVVKVDKQFNIQYSNLKTAELLGLKREVITGTKCYDHFKTEHCKTENCAVARAMKTNSVTTAETVAQPNGQTLSIVYTGTPILNNEGEVVGGLEAITDVTAMQNEYSYLERSTITLIEAMNKFSSGDLTVAVKSERDKGEIHDLFAGFNLTVSNFKNLILQLKDAIEATASASTQISSSTEEMAAGASEQSAQTSEIATAIEEMSRTVIDTASNATVAAEASNEASIRANEGSLKLENSKLGMKRIVNSTESVGSKIKSLTNKTEQIGKIAQVIDDIADQTNLLALNAAIEAARAGEHGRGFAVVADEVRKLAENTTKATKEIADTIRAIQLEGKEADTSMLEAGEAVVEGMRLNEEVGEVLSSILESAKYVSLQISQVAAASEEQSATSEQISSSIEKINYVVNESAAGVHQVAVAAEDLSRLTENLNSLVEQFKVESNLNHFTVKSGKMVV